MPLSSGAPVSLTEIQCHCPTRIQGVSWIHMKQEMPGINLGGYEKYNPTGKNPPREESINEEFGQLLDTLETVPKYLENDEVDQNLLRVAIAHAEKHRHDKEGGAYAEKMCQCLKLATELDQKAADVRADIQKIRATPDFLKWSARPSFYDIELSGVNEKIHKLEIVATELRRQSSEQMHALADLINNPPASLIETLAPDWQRSIIAKERPGNPSPGKREN